MIRASYFALGLSLVVPPPTTIARYPPVAGLLNFLAVYGLDIAFPLKNGILDDTKHEAMLHTNLDTLLFCCNLLHTYVVSY
jgi:hypothetical protein